MKIDWYCPPDINSGMPWSDETHERSGLGGAETEVILLSRELSKLGHEVTIYVSVPLFVGENEFGVKWLPHSDFNPYDNRDIFILHRSWMQIPKEFEKVKARAKVYFSCDQFTQGGKASRDAEIYPFMDSMFFISPYHKAYTRIYANSQFITDETTYITNLGIRREDYEIMPEKEPLSLIFSSVPMRGLEYMIPIMNKIWSMGVPAKLTITSDYRLWGVPDARNEDVKSKFAGMPNVRFLGKITRRELVQEQLKADIMAYSCNYDENFCIAAAEAMAAGAVPVTTNVGALTTTVPLGTGVLIGGFPNHPGYQDTFANAVSSLLVNSRQSLLQMRENGRRHALENYSADVIAKKWIEQFETIIKRKEGTK